MEVNFMKLNDSIIMMRNQIQQARKQIIILKEEQLKMKEQLQQQQKSKTQRLTLQDKVLKIRENINKQHEKLYICKNQSLEQKQQYLKLQAEQFKINQQIEQEEESQRLSIHTQNNQRRYNKLITLRQKLIGQKESFDDNLTQILDKKIEEASLIRTNIDHLDVVIQDCQSKTEQQYMVIQGLLRKIKSKKIAYADNSLLESYKLKYQEIMFDSQGSKGKRWKDYKQYLQQLLKSNQLKEIGSTQQLPKSKFRSKVVSSNRSFVQGQHYQSQQSLRNSNYFQSKARSQEHERKSITQPTKNNEARRNKNVSTKIYTQPPTLTKLPTILNKKQPQQSNPLYRRKQHIKLSESDLDRKQDKKARKYSDVHKAESLNQPLRKQQISNFEKKNPKEEFIKSRVKEMIKKQKGDVELQSMKSDQSSGSGEVIEVEFHRHHQK